MTKKTKKLIIYITLMLIITIGITALINLKNNSSLYSMGMLNVDGNNNWDFGVTNMQEGKVSHKFKLINSSDEQSVRIEKIYTSCGCTTAYIIDENGERYGEFGMQGHGLQTKADIEVGANDSIILEAIFDPEAHGPDAIGKIKRLVYIETNSKTKPKIQLELSADVINEKVLKLQPKAKTDITEYNFGEIFKKDGVVNKEFIIKNIGDANLIIGDITTSCGCTTAIISNKTILPKDNATITVSFDPNFHKEPEGKFSRSVFVPTNDPNNKEIEFKIFVELNS